MMSTAQNHNTSIAGKGEAWLDQDGPGRQLVLATILAQVSGEALQGDNLEDTLQRIVNCLTRQLPVAIASIILLNEACTHFIEEVWSGHIDLDLPGGLPWPIEVGAAGRCVQTGRAQLIGDVRKDPDYVVGNDAVLSEYIVPIRHRDRLHGVLNLESTRADFFTPEACTMFDAIAAQVAGAIHLARVVRELEHANRRLRQLSMSDGLTGLANRRCFDEQLAEEWQRSVTHGHALALLLVDIDYFKLLNDGAGHLQGDACLREIAQLCLAVAEHDHATVARLGGDEFAVLLPECSIDRAFELGQCLLQSVRTRHLAHPQSPHGSCVTLSIGVTAQCGCADHPAQHLVATADRALYAAKARGRNLVVALPAGAESPDEASSRCSNNAPLLG